MSAVAPIADKRGYGWIVRFVPEAEGVETAGQRDFLTAVGCKVAQGYYFGKAVPAAAASELLRRNLHLP